MKKFLTEDGEVKRKISLDTIEDLGDYLEFIGKQHNSMAERIVEDLNRIYLTIGIMFIWLIILTILVV